MPRPDAPFKPQGHNKEQQMQSDLHDFLSHLIGTVAMTLVPVVLIAFLTLPSALHRTGIDDPVDPHAPVAHMT
jgi:hypothetical protein